MANSQYEDCMLMNGQDISASFVVIAAAITVAVGELSTHSGDRRRVEDGNLSRVAVRVGCHDT